jgi:superfamily I DNA and/or RNA helicase
MEVVRVGRSDNVHPTLKQFTLESFGGAEGQMQMGKLKRAKVVFCTCVAAGSEMIEKIHFDAVVLDEAAQVTEPTSVIPLGRGCRQLVLVGDHCQLPPTVLSREAELAGLSVSLFEALVAAGVEPLLLDTQV